MEKNVRNFYNDIANDYDKEQNGFGFVRVPEWEIAAAAVKKIAGKEHSLLEIGAGTGRFTIETAPLVKQVTAVDVSGKMLDGLLKKSKEKGITNINTVCGDFMEIPFPDKFDIITSFSALEYIKDPESLFAKIAGLLAPGGHLVITTSHDTFFRFWGRLGNYFRQGIYMEAYSKKRMKRLLTGNGLKVMEMADIGLKNFFIKGILLFVYAKK